MTTAMYRTVSWSAGAGCHGGCGQKLFVEDGKLVRIEGDEEHPWNQGRSCPKALALTQYMYHPNRITHPLKRVGARGEGKFEAISWDEAFDLVEKRFNELKAKYGAESVIFAQGTGRDIGGPITFLAYSFGSPNWVQLGLSGHSCYTPRLVSMKTVVGDFMVADCSQFLERRYDDPRWVPPEIIITWGQDSTTGCPDGFYGHWIVDCMKRGSKIIAVDPRNTWLTSRSVVHLQLRPGTDGALALGMLNVIINEGLYDKDFVAQWTHGFEQLRERVQQYPVEKVATITEIPAADIAAQAAIQWGVPVDMCPDGTSVAHAITALSVVTGNVDNPGGEVIARPAYNVTAYPFTTEELKKLYGNDFIDRMNEKRVGADLYPMVKNFRGWSQPDKVIEQIESGKPYPIKGAWIQTANVIGGQAARTRFHYDAMKKLEFVAVVDLFHNPTTMSLADVILPAATFAEKDSIRSWWAPLVTISKRVQVGECKSDWEINFELAKRFNPDGMRRWNTLKDLFDERLAPAGLTFSDLEKQGGWKWPEEGPSTPYLRHERGLLRADRKPGFNTATGKCELYNETYKSWGLDPLPSYTEPPQSATSTPELFKKYPLVMITGARSQLFFHAEHRQIPWLREKLPDPTVEIHPETAKRYNIYDGEWVYLENDMGRVKRKAKISLKVKPHHVHTMHGWWLPELAGTEPDLFGVWDYQINKIIPGPQCSVSGFGGGQYKTTLCTLTKMEQKG